MEPTVAGTGSPAAPDGTTPGGPTQAPNNPVTSSSGQDPTSIEQQQHTQQQQHRTSLPLHLAGRVSSMRYQLQERPTADDDILPSLLLPTLSTRAGLSGQASGLAAEGDSSEGGDSDAFDWAPGSPDLRQGLLHHHAAGSHGQHKQRHQYHRSPGRHSRLAGRQQQHGGVGSRLLAGLFGSRGSSSSAAAGGEHAASADPADAAAATADLLESGGSLTFAQQGVPAVQQAAAAAAAATAAATLHQPPAAAGAGSSSRLAYGSALDSAFSAGEEPASRCHSEPPAPPLSSAATGEPGHLNEEVFSEEFGGVGAGGGGGSRSRAQSVSLGQLSRGKRLWQNAAQRVIAMQHITSSYRPGALQGLDVKRHCYDSWFSALHTEVNVTVVDYNKEQVEIAGNITNAMLPEVLKVARPEWSKVRWINVQGLSWDVITTLAVAFDLHPLSVEDIVHIPQRIKADYYPEYLYASVILLSVDRPSHLSQEQPAAAAATTEPTAATAAAAAAAKDSAAAAATGLRLSDSGGSAAGGSSELPVFASGMGKVQRGRLFGAAGAKKRRVQRRAAAACCSAALQPMQPTVEQASMFLFRDGTLITLFQSVSNDTIARRLMGKLEGFRSLLTDSQDASYLFNAVLDSVVDHTLPLVQVYSSRIATLESRVLLDSRPRASLTKELHLLSNDLKLLRRTLVPTQHLVHKLQSTHDKDNNQGFLSPLTVLYLSDVYDHISTVVEDMVSLSEDAKDLIDLIFNTIAHNNNSSMQMLAVVSTIFLPITFLAGVYGTNFDQWFPEIHWSYGYVYFWGACLFITVGFSAWLQRLGMFDYSGSRTTY